MKLNTKSFGLASGITWGGLVLLTTIMATSTTYGRAFTTLVMSMYPGYTVSPIGGLIGAVYGLVDGFVCGYVFSWIYNRFEGKR